MLLGAVRSIGGEVGVVNVCGGDVGVALQPPDTTLGNGGDSRVAGCDGDSDR